VAKFLTITDSGTLSETENTSLKALTINGSGFIEEAEITGTAAGWNPPSDWIDISTVGNNEINLLVGDFGTAVAFSTDVDNSGTYTIDWGDDTIETLRDSGTIYQHQYTIGSGTACSEGYTTFKIRIYNATDDITRWQIGRHDLTVNTQYSPILWAVFGTTAITDYSLAFYDATSNDVNCLNLRSCTIPTFESCTTAASMFRNCYSLVNVDLPTSWGGITTCATMFYSCYSLIGLNLPTSWGSVTDCLAMFQYCYSLISIGSPTSWGDVTNCTSMFRECRSLRKITLPTSMGSITNCADMFYNCFSLEEIINEEYLGNSTSDCDFTRFGYYCENLQTAVTIDSRIAQLGILGSSVFRPKLTSLRLTNTNSTFSGSSPQIDISYCSLDATALDALFGDLPTITGKTIKITANTGVATCDKTIATNKGWTVTT
jgi:hypothetical protein